MIDAATKTTGTAQRAERSALRQLRLAEPVGAVRAPADGPPRLQPHRQPPAERVVLVDHGEANAGLSEQRRPAVSRRAEPARFRVEAAAAVDVAAIGAVEEHDQRAARRAHRLRGGSNFGYPSGIASRNDPSSFADSGGFAITTPSNTDRLVHVERPELAQRADLQHRRHADVEPACAHHHLRRQRAGLERVVVGQQIVPGSRSASTPTSTRRRHVHHHELPRRVERATSTAARATYAVLTGRVASVNSQAVLDANRQVRGAGPSTLRRRHQGLRHVRAGFLADEAEPDPDRRPPLRRPDAVRAVQQRDVVGDDGQHLRTIGPRRRRHLQQVQLPRSRRARRRRPGVHPARARDGGLQDRLEQLRAVGERRLAAERAVGVPARASRRSRIRRRCAPATPKPTIARG